MKKKRALICGVSGQDGTLISKLLLDKNYEVWGTSRSAEENAFQNLKRAGVFGQVNLLTLNTANFDNVLEICKRVNPNEIYFLGSQSSVSMSFNSPTQTINSIVIGALNFLEAIRVIGGDIKFFNPGSSECYGNTSLLPCNEDTVFSPLSPYAAAKVAAHILVVNYRKNYKIFACNGILFNHESSYRPAHFVTQKIISSAYNISIGKQGSLKLGRTDIMRDWGAASEFVNGMWLTLQSESPEDYVFATGVANTLEEFVAEVFSCFELEWQKYVVQEVELFRPSEISVVWGDPRKAREKLGWSAKISMKQLARQLVSEHIELKKLSMERRY